jgi:hypothetical protein
MGIHSFGRDESLLDRSPHDEAIKRQKLEEMGMSGLKFGSDTTADRSPTLFYYDTMEIFSPNFFARISNFQVSLLQCAIQYLAKGV